jgi:hypothetical protein
MRLPKLRKTYRDFPLLLETTNQCESKNEHCNLCALVYANHKKMLKDVEKYIFTTNQPKVLEIITGIINCKLFDVANLFTSN